MVLFDNIRPEEFLLFVENFKITLALGTVSDNVKIQYICVILCVEALLQFDTLCALVGSTTATPLNGFILGLGVYFFPVNVLAKQNRAMLCEMSKTSKLKLICYNVLLIDIDESFDAFP